MLRIGSRSLSPGPSFFPRGTERGGPPVPPRFLVYPTREVHMPSRNRIPDDEREAIAAAIREGRPRNEIAREFNRSAGTVSNIATEFGLTDAFDRSATKNATEARQADNQALRAELSHRLL